MFEERLVIFFCLLMRDLIPVGSMIEALNQAKTHQEWCKIELTNHHLEELARDLVKRLS